MIVVVLKLSHTKRLNLSHLVVCVHTDKSSSLRSITRRNQSISRSLAFGELDNMMLESSAASHSTGSQISSNQEQNNGHVENDDDL